MYWQWIIVGLLIAVSGLYVGRQTWRTWFGKSTGGCGGGCACSGKAKNPAVTGQERLITVDQLTAHLRQQPR